MKHLVLGVSPESSLDLLREFADVIVLDKDLPPTDMPIYDTLYIRSHFGQPSTLPQNFRSEIEDIVSRAKLVNPNIKFIDGIDTVDKILSTEDKWLQYQTYGEFMPKTQLLSTEFDTSNFKHPVFKNRLSSRGNGVTWDIKELTGPAENWLVQESLEISEELRVYAIRGEVYPISAIRQSKTLTQNTQAVDSRQLIDEEIEFSLRIAKLSIGMDILGIDIARTQDGKLYVMEVNRSPGFAAFANITGVNLASLLYTEKL